MSKGLQVEKSRGQRRKWVSKLAQGRLNLKLGPVNMVKLTRHLKHQRSEPFATSLDRVLQLSRNSGLKLSAFMVSATSLGNL